MPFDGIAPELLIKPPERLYPLRLHPEQQRLMHSDARFKVVPAGRRSGKTELAKRQLITAALSETTYPDARFFAAAPTRDQAKRIFWNDLKQMTPPCLMLEPPKESELVLTYVTGATISVVGMDRPERIEGSPWNGGVLDECANMKPQAWPENVRPALSDRNGWCWLIGVPEGRNHYYDLWKLAISGRERGWEGFTWFTSEVLPLYLANGEEEIEAARRQLDDLTFQQEYEGSFVSFEGRAYYPFDERTHCAQLEYNPAAPIGLCFDFNVDPGVCAIVQEMVLPNGLEGTGVIGEVHIPRNSNTPAVCRKVLQDWGDHQSYVYVYGDATGGARGSAKVQGSDWDLVKRELQIDHEGDNHYYDPEQTIYRVPKANPSERTRINAVNSRLRSSTGEVRLMVDPRYAPTVVRDFEGVQLLKGGSGEIDKKSDPKLSHISDAVGYYIVHEFPTTVRIQEQRPMYGAGSYRAEAR